METKSTCGTAGGLLPHWTTVPFVHPLQRHLVILVSPPWWLILTMLTTTMMMMRSIAPLRSPASVFELIAKGRPIATDPSALLWTASIAMEKCPVEVDSRLLGMSPYNLLQAVPRIACGSRGVLTPASSQLVLLLFARPWHWLNRVRTAFYSILSLLSW